MLISMTFTMRAFVLVLCVFSTLQVSLGVDDFSSRTFKDFDIRPLHKPHVETDKTPVVVPVVQQYPPVQQIPVQQYPPLQQIPVVQYPVLYPQIQQYPVHYPQYQVVQQYPHHPQYHHGSHYPHHHQQYTHPHHGIIC